MTLRLQPWHMQWPRLSQDGRHDLRISSYWKSLKPSSPLQDFQVLIPLLRSVDRERLFGSVTIQHLIDPICEQADPTEALGPLVFSPQKYETFATHLPVFLFVPISLCPRLACWLLGLGDTLVIIPQRTAPQCSVSPHQHTLIQISWSKWLCFKTGPTTFNIFNTFHRFEFIWRTSVASPSKLSRSRRACGCSCSA